MVYTFICMDCGLKIVSGWNHGWGHEDGYSAFSHLACSECGTMHQIKHSITKGVWVLAHISPAFAKPIQPDQLLAQPKPIHVSPDDDSEIHDFKHEDDWITRDVPHELRPLRRRLLFSPMLEGLNQYLALEAVVCFQCGSYGSLRLNWKETDRCPSCTSHSLKIKSGFIT